MLQSGSPGSIAARSKWLVFPRPNREAPVRLFCFASAGHGPAMFRSWAPLLPPDVELGIAHLPGRESRWKEPPAVRITELTTALADAMESEDGRPIVFFGHSLGALVAFELARRMRERSRKMPVGLIASAHRAPQEPNRHPRLSHLSDAEFVRQVDRRHGGIPEVVASNQELMELMLPSLRADYRLFEDYEHAAAAPLSCPILVFGGTADIHVTRQDLEPWAKQTTGDFKLQMFEGGHFFVNDLRAGVVSTAVAWIRAELGAAAAAARESSLPP